MRLLSPQTVNLVVWKNNRTKSQNANTGYTSDIDNNFADMIYQELDTSII